AAEKRGGARMPKTAIVTAGVSAIGRVLVRALAGAGYRVGFTHMGEGELANELEAEIAELGGTARGWLSDAGDAAAVSDLHLAVAEWAGSVPEVLVNNAGIQTWAPLLELAVEDWDAVMRTNLRGAFLNSKAFGQAL